MEDLRNLPRSAFLGPQTTPFSLNYILTLAIYPLSNEQKKLAALELGHLMRKRGLQKPIDISVELTEEPQNL
jgi:hypothetical protein